MPAAFRRLPCDLSAPLWRYVLVALLPALRAQSIRDGILDVIVQLLDFFTGGNAHVADGIAT